MSTHNEYSKRKEKTVEPINESLVPMIVQFGHLRRQRTKEDSRPERLRQPHADPPKVRTNELMPGPASGPFCARCQNVGYLRTNVPYGHPLFGKAVECECRLAKKKEAHR